jgi:hypothetical protein
VSSLISQPHLTHKVISLPKFSSRPSAPSLILCLIRTAFERHLSHYSHEEEWNERLLWTLVSIVTISPTVSDLGLFVGCSLTLPSSALVNRVCFISSNPPVLSRRGIARGRRILQVEGHRVNESQAAHH